jgi:hypothetical protein
MMYARCEDLSGRASLQASGRKNTANQIDTGQTAEDTNWKNGMFLTLIICYPMEASSRIWGREARQAPIVIISNDSVIDELKRT